MMIFGEFAQQDGVICRLCRAQQEGEVKGR
jgi:hypothetical protein